MSLCALPSSSQHVYQPEGNTTTIRRYNSPRGYRLSASRGAKLRSPLKPLALSHTLSYWGIQGRPLIRHRGASLSKKYTLGVFFSSRHVSPTLVQPTPRLFSALPPLISPPSPLFISHASTASYPRCNMSPLETLLLSLLLYHLTCLTVSLRTKMVF